MPAELPLSSPAPRESFVPVGSAAVYVRDIGQGRPIVILHGGPEFDHTYLLPDMDRLADTSRLIYYDQRGRGRSAEGVDPEEVTLTLDIQDLDDLRAHLGLETTAVLGHSWGGVLAMEYAVRHPDRVSHLIIMDSAPASHEDALVFREDRRVRAADDLETKRALAAGAGFQAGDPEAVTAFYRVHFRKALVRPEHLDRVMEAFRASFARGDILKAWAVDDRLTAETHREQSYTLFPRLRQLRIPTLVVHGEHDVVPLSCAVHIAEAIPGARLVVVRDAGHFPYLERPEETGRIVAEFLGR